LGIYLVIEKIKRTKNRLNLKKLDDNIQLPNDISRVNIYEVTGFGRNFGSYRLLHYPKYESVTDDQLSYIIEFDNSFRQLMKLSTFNDP
jgi:hypothetical protein